MSELRQRVLDYIRDADIRFLRMIEALAESYNADEEIVAFDSAGNPLSKTAYNKALQEAEAEVERGEIISTEELEKDSKSW
ncbi:MAG: hypothetical protein RLZZ241_2111 [Bacteroidota bacterium]